MMQMFFLLVKHANVVGASATQSWEFSWRRRTLSYVETAYTNVLKVWHDEDNIALRSISVPSVPSTMGTRVLPPK